MTVPMKRAARRRLFFVYASCPRSRQETVMRPAGWPYLSAVMVPPSTVLT